MLSVWPGKPPGEITAKGAERAQEQRPNEKQVVRLTDVSLPTLTLFRAPKEKNTGATVVIAPGGGYGILAWDLEGEEVAQWLNGMGVNAVLLKYRVPRPVGQPNGEQPQGPLMDAQRSISLVRSKAKDWGVDPGRIGMLGFSAGGHLTAAASTSWDRRAYPAVDAVDQVSCRPDFTILIYPAYLMDPKSEGLIPEIRVTKETPPTFLAHAYDDPIHPENSLRYFTALKRAGVPAELHIYRSGGHGYGLRPSEHHVTSWPTRCGEWMKAQGLLAAKK